ncbi:hypothetical protein Sm713_24470 [Streptomyces sp. TS71-3]|nr:hypothetical protein Sm713_24470 [Streptomyces sp. TS71-3]
MGDEGGDRPEGTRLHAQATDRARIYQALRDLHVSERHQHFYYLDGVRAVRRAKSGGEPGDCPYPGLSSFGADQARWFFGRDELVSDLLVGLDRRLWGGGGLAVVAPSGAGKSSLLEAGLLPAVAAGLLPVEGSRDWPRAVLTPTEHPLTELADRLAEVTGTSPRQAADVLAEGPAESVSMLREALGRQSGAGQTGAAHRRWILVVDQLEELFTLCTDERERAAFLAVLGAVAEAEPGGRGPAGLVVYGLRSDFYTRCAEYPGLRSVLQDGPVLVGSMSATRVREAIIFPARDVGLEVDPGLVEVLLRDLGAPAHSGEAGDGATAVPAGYEAGRLPLLAHALRATWQQQHGRALTVEGYEATGGIARAVRTTAEEHYTRLDEAGRAAARAVLLRLVKIGAGGEDTRQRVPYGDLLGHGGDSAAAMAVVETFTGARLLTREGDSVEITHEVLLRAWPRLRDWIEADRPGNLVRQELEAAAADWEHAGRDPGMLHSGSRLAAAEAWAGSAPSGALSSTASAFLTASVHRRRRALGVRNAVIAALVVLFLSACTAAFIAQHQRTTAQTERDRAIFSQLTARAEALRGNQPSLAAQLDIAAYRMRQTSGLYTHLVTDANNPLSTTLTGHTGPVYTVALSPDGHTLASAGYDGTLRLWDVPYPARTRPLGAPLLRGSSAIDSVAFSPDGHILASAGTDGKVRLWDLADRAHATPLGSPLPGHTSVVRWVAFSPDGQTLAAAGSDGTVRLWNLTDPAYPAPLGKPLTGHTGVVNAVAFSPDGHLLAGAGADGRVRLWDLTHPSRATPLGSAPSRSAGAVWAVAFSADGHVLATSGAEGTVRLWDVTDPARTAPLGRPLPGHTGTVYSLAFSPSRHTLASAGEDGTVRLWDVTHPATAVPLGSPLSTSTGPVFSVAFSADGHVLAAAGADHTVRLWNRSTPLGTDLTSGRGDAVNAVAFSPDGHTLASAGADQAVRLWNLADRAHDPSPGRPLTGHSNPVEAVAFSPDGHVLASAGSDGTVRLWDVTRPAHATALGTLTGHTGPVLSVAFSPDGHTLASAGDDGTVRLWDVTDPGHVTRLDRPVAGHGNPVNAVAFAPSGHVLAGADTLGAVRLWDVADPRHAAALGSPLNSGTGPVHAVAFAPDGHALASAGTDGTVRLWDVADPRHAAALGSPLNSNNGPVRTVAFSSDGHTLASAGAHDVWLWDLDDPADTTPLDPPLTGHSGPVNAVAFSPDEQTLVSAGDDGTVWMWSMSADQAIRQICKYTNPLTPRQWKQYVPQLPFTPPCG